MENKRIMRKYKCRLKSRKIFTENLSKQLLLPDSENKVK